jgi:hypothetical protein
MQPIRPAIRRHAIFKREYRRAARAADFHTLTSAAQWALLRAEVLAGAPDGKSSLLEILDSRESRRDEVLARLEAAHRLDAQLKRESSSERPE